MNAQGEPPASQSGQGQSMAQVARADASRVHEPVLGQHDGDSTGDDVGDHVAPSHGNPSTCREDSHIVDPVFDLGLQQTRASQLPTIRNLVQLVDGVGDSQPRGCSAQDDLNVPVPKHSKEISPLVGKEHPPSITSSHQQGGGSDGALAGDSSVRERVGNRKLVGSVENLVITDPLNFWRRLVLRIYGPQPDDTTCARINYTEEAGRVLQAQREQIAKKTEKTVKSTQKKPVPSSPAAQSQPPLAFVGNWEGAIAYGRRVTEKPKWLPADDETIEKILADPEPWIQEFVLAFGNQQDLRDREGSAEVKKFSPDNFSKLRVEIEAACRTLFLTLASRVLFGYRGRKDRLGLQVVTDLEDRNCTCEERIRSIVDGLKFDKRICRDVLQDPQKAEDFVNSPLETARIKVDTARNNESRHKLSAKKEKVQQDRKQKTELCRSESTIPSPATPTAADNRASSTPDQPQQEARLDIPQGRSYPAPNRPALNKPSLYQGQGGPYQGHHRARFGPGVFPPPFNPLPPAQIYPNQFLKWLHEQDRYQHHPMGYQHPQHHNPCGYQSNPFQNRPQVHAKPAPRRDPPRNDPPARPLEQGDRPDDCHNDSHGQSGRNVELNPPAGESHASGRSHNEDAPGKTGQCLHVPPEASSALVTQSSSARHSKLTATKAKSAARPKYKFPFTPGQPDKRAFDWIKNSSGTDVPSSKRRKENESDE